MPTSARHLDLMQQRIQIQDEIAHLEAFRPGSLTPRFRKCGKPNCHCAQEGDPGHGPTWSLTRPVHGKTKTVVVPLEAVEETKAQIERYRRFRELTKQLVEVNVLIADESLERIKAGRSPSDGREKRDSPDNSPQVSRTR